MRAWIAFAVAVFAGGCFDPQFKDQLACDTGGQCPPGLVCGADNVCHETAGVDDDAGPPPDAFRFPDATPVDCVDDDDCTVAPNPCLSDGVCDTAAGVCNFTAVDCSSLDTECLVGMCDPSSGACVAANANEGDDCGAGIVCDAFGPCGGFTEGTCDSTGEQSRDCTTHTCQQGSCVGTPSVQTEACTRVTEGVDCGTDTVTGCGTCGSFSSTCDEGGSQTCTCTDFKCVSDSCQSMATSCTQPCTRDTDGVVCGSVSQSCGSSCTYTSTCDNDGPDLSCTCTTPRCAGGSCSGSSSASCIEDCSRSTVGDDCCVGCFISGEPDLRAGTCNLSGTCSATTGSACGECF